MTDDRRVVCLGTSPAMLFRGLRLARQGWRVLFVDAAENIGGGWRTTEAFGALGVETGVHLFENRASTNLALASLFEANELTRDCGHGQIGRTRIGLRASRSLLYAGLVTRAARRGSGERARHSLKKFGATFANRRLPLLYPAAGMAELFSRLQARLVDGGATFRFGTRIHAVQLRSGGVALHTEMDERIDAEMLVFSSRAHAPFAGAEQMWQDLDAKIVTNILLALPDEAPLFDGYVEIFAHPMIKRTRRFARALPDGGSIIVAQARTADPCADQVMASLADLGLIAGGARAHGAQVERFAFRTLPSGPAARLARGSGGRLQFLQTVDFSDEDHMLA